MKTKLNQHQIQLKKLEMVKFRQNLLKTVLKV